MKRDYAATIYSTASSRDRMISNLEQAVAHLRSGDDDFGIHVDDCHLSMALVQPVEASTTPAAAI